MNIRIEKKGNSVKSWKKDLKQRTRSRRRKSSLNLPCNKIEIKDQVSLACPKLQLIFRKDTPKKKRIHIAQFQTLLRAHNRFQKESAQEKVRMISEMETRSPKFGRVVSQFLPCSPLGEAAFPKLKKTDSNNKNIFKIPSLSIDPLKGIVVGVTGLDSRGSTDTESSWTDCATDSPFPMISTLVSTEKNVNASPSFGSGTKMPVSVASPACTGFGNLLDLPCTDTIIGMLEAGAA